MTRSRLAAAALAGVFFLPASGFGSDSEVRVVEIRGGTAVFDATTNISAITIHGKSTSLQGHAHIRRSPDGLVIERLEAVVPVQTLNTGMGLRDDHMRRRVFETSKGVAPDLRFAAENVSCEGAGDTKTCRVTGDLVIRDTPRPFAITLRVTERGTAFHVAGDSIVRLSSYGIEAPSQLGVTTADDVSLHIEFVGKLLPQPVVTTAEKR
jgi:polyisoprenoid-binding protein YceI